MFEEKIPWIQGSPLGIKIRSIGFVPTHMHEQVVEIILCLKGEVKFSYGYEEFTLSEGEFISVDKDAHFLSKGEKENLCVSFYIDLKWFLLQYPFITSLLFVCEASKESEKPYPSYYHEQLKGILLSILFYLSKRQPADFHDVSIFINGAKRIADILINHFDIAFYYNPDLQPKTDMMERNRNMMLYLQSHYSEKITLESIAGHFNLTKSYTSEFLRTFEVGFRKSLGYIRANNSEKLLLTTDMKIMDISEACGFSDAKYYYKAFKEWYKCTPKQFRVNYRDKMKEANVEREIQLTEVLTPLNQMIQKHYLELFLL